MCDKISFKFFSFFLCIVFLSLSILPLAAFHSDEELKDIQPLPSTSKFISSLSDLTTLIRMRPKQNQNSMNKQPTFKWNEHWDEHNKSLTLRYWNHHHQVAFYSDNYRKWTWLISYIPKVWDYMKKNYGLFGPDNYLYIVYHATENNSSEDSEDTNDNNYLNNPPLIGYSLDPDSNYDRRNVLDLTLSYSYLNATINSTEMNQAKDLVTNLLAYFVENSSRGCFGSPSFPIWKESSSSYLETRTFWMDVFTYDVYINLNLDVDAERYRAEKEVEATDNPREETYWFRDWFLPIYEEFGGKHVLRDYFALVKHSVHCRGSKYHYDLNMGEFIHFWSGASRACLTQLAWNAFGWSKSYSDQVISARIKYHWLNDIYNATDDVHNPTLNDSDPFVDLQVVPSSAEIEGSSNEKENERINEVLSERNDIIITACTVIFLFILIFLTAVIFYKRKIQNLQVQIRSLTNEEVKEFFQGQRKPSLDDDQGLILAMPFMKDLEIPRDQIIIAHDKVIGTGQFGYVAHGFVRLSDDNQLVPVAMKMAKPDVDVVYFKAFLSEVKIMTYLGKHENIVNLLGTCTANIKNREILIALELCPLGNLLDYLKNNRHLCHIEEREKKGNFASSFDGLLFELGINSRFESQSSSEVQVNLAKITFLDLLRWSHNISNAMVYLAQKKVIHGDLAARNILLTANRTAKISDFGLSRQVLNYANYMKTSKTPVPWRWLAIECMKEQKFSTASDVWAYGVLLWEIFSLGEIPYGCYTYDLFFVDKLISGERLLKPLHASDPIYQLMQECWTIEPSNRISFEEIHIAIERSITKSYSTSVTHGYSENCIDLIQSEGCDLLCESESCV